MICRAEGTTRRDQSIPTVGMDISKQENDCTNMRLNRFFIVAIAAVTFALFAGVKIGTTISSQDGARSLKKLEDAFVVLEQRYVEVVDTDKLAISAIQGMLDDLDPHSIYIDKSDIAAVNENFNAEFEGIGISYELLPGKDGADTLAVLNVLPGGPSEEVGLQSGDKIIAVDGKSAIGYTDAEVKRNLKGPRGSLVTVSVQRPGIRQTIEFEITREKVAIVTLDTGYMIDKTTGLIRLNRFARTTHQEFRQALIKLRGQGMKRLILDLRGNSGGYMEMAIDISDEFLSDGQVIVSQRGRSPQENVTFSARAGGLWEKEPLIVLVDGSSASASEIVAGAIQDHDRGLIVGRRTFGKGLVQKQYRIADGSVMRVTVARYYTPSGRLIQTPYKDGDRTDYYLSKADLRKTDGAKSSASLLSEVPDSLKFKTDSGRIVIAGGGIIPDFIVAIDSLSELSRAVIGRSLETEFVRRYIANSAGQLQAQWGDNPAAFRKNFDVDAKLSSEFLDFVATRGVVVGNRASESSDLDADRSFTEAEWEEDRIFLQALLKGRLATRLFDRSEFYPIYGKVDHLLNESQGLWNHAQDLATHYAGL